MPPTTVVWKERGKGSLKDITYNVIKKNIK